MGHPLHGLLDERKRVGHPAVEEQVSGIGVRNQFQVSSFKFRVAGEEAVSYQLSALSRQKRQVPVASSW